MLFPTWLQWLTQGPGHGKRRRRPSVWRGFRPRLDALEDRTVPSTFTVTSLADTGPGTLRAEVALANAHPGADAIQFAGGLHGFTRVGHYELQLVTGFARGIHGVARFLHHPV